MKKVLVALAAVTLFEVSALAVVADRFECTSRIVKDGVIVSSGYKTVDAVRESQLGGDNDQTSAHFDDFLGGVGGISQARVSYSYQHKRQGINAFQSNMCVSVSYCIGRTCTAHSCAMPTNPPSDPDQHWKWVPLGEGGIPTFLASELQPIIEPLEDGYTLQSSCRHIKTFP